MPARNLFVRDPREIPFLHSQVEGILALATRSQLDISVRDDDDFGFMTIQFLYKQVQHGDSILLLVPRRDAGLIARTMIEGLYQLLWALHAPAERARLWRSFSIIHDWRLLQTRLKEGIPVDEADLIMNEAGLKEFGDLHRLKNPNLPDPYHKKWRGAVSLSNMADVVGRDLYDGAYGDGPYVQLSDWEHWGVSGIGDSISRENDHFLVKVNSDRVTGLSLLAAFQCLLQTLEVADAHLSLHMTDTIQTFRTDFIDTLNSFYRR